MDVSAVAKLATAMSQAETATAVNTAVLKKSMDLQQESVMMLLQALPQAVNPAHLGQTIDVFG